MVNPKKSYIAKNKIGGAKCYKLLKNVKCFEHLMASYTGCRGVKD
jgi:hypothetical protein